MKHFGKEFYDFFIELEKNNKKDWFDKNRKRYETEIKKPFENFTAELGEKIYEFDNQINTEYRKSIFRINRDIRFSKDKTPYKLNRTAAFSKYGRKDKGTPGYYIDINPKKCYLAGGAWNPSTTHLNKIRQEIYYCSDEFHKIVNDGKFKKSFGSLKGDIAKRLPKEWKEKAVESEYIFNKQFYYVKEFNPKLVFKENFIDSVIEDFKSALPINLFLRRAMEDVE